VAADNLRMDLVAGRKDLEEAARMVVVRIVAGRTEAGRMAADHIEAVRMVVVRTGVVRIEVDRIVVHRDLEVAAVVVGYAITFNTG
jgi:hypothetical protein